MCLLAGVAKRSITPHNSQFLCGYPHCERMSTGANDNIYATALCLENKGSFFVTISVDILYLSPQSVAFCRSQICQQTGVDARSVWLNCTHTHSAPLTFKTLSWSKDTVLPDVDEAYLELMHTAIIESACEAIATKRKAKMATSSVTIEGAGCNRHSLDAPRDNEVTSMAIKDVLSGKLIALSYYYAMHPTVLHEDSFLVSSDFPGYSRSFLKKEFGEEVEVLFNMGPSGNQSPRYHVNAQTIAEAERLGGLLGGAIAESVRGVLDENYSDDPCVMVGERELQLPRKDFPSGESSQLKLNEAQNTFKRLSREGAERAALRTAECAVFGAEESVALSEVAENGILNSLLEADYSPITVSVARIGDTYAVGLPGEIFVEYGLDIKSRSGKNVCIATLVNGDLQGYIVTEESHAQGGYEASNSVFSYKAGPLIVDAIVTLLDILGDKS